MNTYEIIRFIPVFSEPPVEYVLRTDEENEEQKLYIVEETKDFFSTESCCGQYCIKYTAGKRTESADPSFREELKSLLSRKDIERQLGDLNRLNPEYKGLIGAIMDEIRGH